MSLQEINRTWFAMKGLLPSWEDEERALGDVTAPVDWRRIDSNLAENLGWTPRQIDAMTLPEIKAVCTKSLDSVDWDLIELFKKLKPKDRLELARWQREVMLE